MLTTRQGASTVDIEQLIAQHVADALTTLEANWNDGNGTPHEKGTDVVGYIYRFQELALLCLGMVLDEEKKIERCAYTAKYAPIPRLSQLDISKVTESNSTEGKLIKKLLLNLKCMSYLVRAYYGVSPTRYYKDDPCWSADLKSKTTKDIINIGSFMEVLLSSMENENTIRTLGDYPRPSHEGYRNTIELPDENIVVPLQSDTIQLVQNGCSFHKLRSEDPNQHLKGFLKLVDSLDLDVANKEKKHLRESLSEAWTRFKDLLQKPSPWPRSLAPILSARSYPMEDPQCSSHIHNSINVIKMCSKQTNEFQNDPSQDKTLIVSEIREPPSMRIKSLSKLLSTKYQSQSSLGEHNRSLSSPKRVHFINSVTILNKEDEPRDAGIVKPDTKNDDHDTIIKREKESEEEEGREEIDDSEYININPPSPPPPNPSNSFIIEKVFKLNLFHESLNLVPSSSNIQFVCTKENDGDVMEDPDGIRGLSQVVLEKPFVEIYNMTHDLSLGVVRFTNGIDEIAYKMPRKIEQFNSRSDLEIEHTKSVHFRNKEDKRRGLEYVMSKILWFYKECLELRPEYQTGLEDEG
ncbi:hypothetical protein Tco_0548633 [Tanacetum coccineum]